MAKRKSKKNHQSKVDKHYQQRHENKNEKDTNTHHKGTNSIQHSDESQPLIPSNNALCSKLPSPTTSYALTSFVTFLSGVLLSTIYFHIIGPQQHKVVQFVNTCNNGNSIHVDINANQNHSNVVHKTSDSNIIHNDIIQDPEKLNRESREFSSPSTCSLYVARSTIPNAGLGIYTSKGIPKNHPVGPSDIVIQLPDLNPYYHSSLQVLSYQYYWDGQDTGGQYEGRKVYSLIPGIGMLANGHPDDYNTVQSNGSTFDNGGLYRSSHPAAGSSSSYFNYTFFASKDIPPGGEILVQYGKEWFEERIRKNIITTPSPSSSPSSSSLLVRSQEWLEQNGICLDNIQVKQSTNPQAGRGAFATKSIGQGDIVAPAPVIQITNRQSMKMLKVKTDPINGDVVERSEQLLLNYCFGHVNSSILLYPISPLVNYINHDSNKTNVKLRWSKSLQHDIQNPQNITIEDIKQMKHAGLMLEFVATKNIKVGDEIFLDYGTSWEKAWREHVNKWRPIDVEKDDALLYPNVFDSANKMIKTIREQQMSPYPENFFTSCYYRYQKRQSGHQDTIRYNDTKTTLHDENLRPCMILDRHEYYQNGEKEFLYTVGIQNRFGLSEAQRIPQGEKHIVGHVPRHAIKFSSKVFTSDQHLEKAFRHAINVPDDIYPDKWLDL